MNGFDILDSIYSRLEILKNSNFSRDKKILMMDEIISEIHPEILFSSVDQTLNISRALLDLAIVEKYPKGVATGYNGLGFADYLRSNHESAVNFHLKALKIFREIGFRAGEGNALNGIAGSHLSMGNYDQAFDHALKSLEIARGIHNKTMEGWCLHGLGIGYQEFGDSDTALKYFQDSLNSFLSIDYAVGIARALTGIGSLYLNKGEFAEAKNHFDHSLELYRESENLMGEARALSDLGLVSMHMGEFGKSLQYHNESLAIRQRIGNRQSETTSLFNLGLLFFKEKDLETALSYFNETLELAGILKIKPRIYQTHLYLAKIFEMQNQFQSALFHQKAYSKLREEVLGDENNTRLRNLTISKKIEQSEREAELAREQNALLNSKNSELQEVIKKLHDAQARLVQTEKMAAQGKLVAGLLHEINTPIGAIISATDVLKRGFDKLTQSPKLSQRREIIAMLQSLPVLQQASDRLLDRVQNLKSFMQLDESHFKRYQLLDGLRATLQLLESELSERIEILTEFDALPEIYCHAAEINQVFWNILSNAIAAISEQGEIRLRTKLVGKKIHIEIEDNGIGMSPEQRERIFEPGFSRDGVRVKTGFGLFSALNIVQKHGGEILVDSHSGKGTRFRIILPVEVLIPKHNEQIR